MKEKIFIGAGGAAREMNAHIGGKHKYFVELDYFDGYKNNIYPINEIDIFSMEAIIAAGDSILRQKIYKRLPTKLNYFSFIHPTALILGDVTIGLGCFVSANCILTTDIIIGSHSYLNRAAMIGHDCQIGDFFTMSPNSTISGNCYIGNRVSIGAHACVKQNISICSDVIIGMQSAVIKDIEEPGIYVGVPARKIKDLCVN